MATKHIIFCPDQLPERSSETTREGNFESRQHKIRYKVSKIFRISA
jgi:hypothetical protein